MSPLESPEIYDEAIEKELHNEAVRMLKMHGIEDKISLAACRAWRDHAELKVNVDAKNNPSANIHFAIERAKLLGDAELYEYALEELYDAETMAISQNDEGALERIGKGMEIYNSKLSNT